jgi:PilS N terminal
MKKPLPQAQKRQSGNAILFTLLAMVIGGVVVAVGITQYQDADRAAQIQGAVAEVNSIIGNAKQNYGQYSYVGLVTQVAVGSRVIPPNLAVQPAAAGTAPTTARNKFRGAINLQASATPSSADLTYAQVPSEICTALVNGTQGLAENITVGGTAVKTPGSIVNIGALNNSCGAAVSDIVWTFGRT